MPQHLPDTTASVGAQSVQAAEPGAYFTRVSARSYRPTVHTTGAWSPTEQHISPLNGLVVHAIERFVAARDEGEDDGKTISRISFDILGAVPVEDFDIDVELLRPGRTIELVEARVTSGGRQLLRASAWRLAGFDTQDVAAGETAHLAAPDVVPWWDMTTVWPGGYIASLEVARSADSRPGRATAWVSTPLELLAGEQVSRLAGFVALVDTANGICVRQSPQDWMFPNVDLTIHLHRSPEAGPVGLDTTVTFGAAGHGVTTTVLHDRRGPVGQAAQALTIRRQPRPER